MNLIIAGDMGGALAKFGELPEWLGQIEFLDGVNGLPAGSFGCFKATLEPGDYAFIAEVPAADEKAMFSLFTVR
jgi:hypothetical protein